MHVMMVTDFYWPLLGGVEQHVRSLAHELCRRSHRVTVVTLDPGDLGASSVDGPVEVVRVKSAAQRLGALFAQPRPWAPPIHDPVAAAAIRRIVQERRPDVVHGHDWLARSALGTTDGRPIVSTLHYYTLSCAKKDLMQGADPCTGPGVLKCARCASRHYGAAKGLLTASANAIGAALERRIADQIIAVSTATAVGNGLDPSDPRVHVIPNFLPPSATDLDRCDPDRCDEADPGDDGLWDADRRLLDRLPSEPFFLYVGDFRPTKGFHVLLEAYAGLATRRPLVVIGKRWPNWTFEPPDGVHVFEEWPNSAVLRAFDRAWAAIVPSLWAEPFGIVAIEALRSGVPVIASRTGGLVDIVDDGTLGTLVEPGSADRLRDAMATLDADDELRERWSRNARVAGEAYRADRVVPRIEAVYDAALGGAGR